MQRLFWLDAPRWVPVAAGIFLGWVGVVALPQIIEASGVPGTVLVAAGGILYTLGAVVYALQRPDLGRPSSASTSSSTCSRSSRRRASSPRSRSWSPTRREERPGREPGRLRRFAYGLMRTTAPPPGPKTVPVVTESEPL